MATVSETGWPYIQHRRGPRGFLKLVDDRTPALPTIVATISTSAPVISRPPIVLACSSWIMNRARLKVSAHVQTLAPADNPALTELATVPDYEAKPERMGLSGWKPRTDLGAGN